MKIALLSFLLLAAVGRASEWEEELDEELPLLGHRNWMVVADAV